MAFGRLRERPIITTKMIKSRGIMTFDALSIPFCTPRDTIKILSKMKAAWAPSAIRGFEMIEVNN